MSDPRWHNPPGMPGDLLPYSLAVRIGGLVRRARLYLKYATPPRPARPSIETRLVPPYLVEIAAVVVAH